MTKYFPFLLASVLSSLLLSCARSPESDNKHTLATPPINSVTNKKPKLMIIGLDGTRPDALQVANTPNLDALANNGVANFNTLTGDISFSGPGWSSMLIGVWCDKHEVLENEFATKNFADYPHFFKRVKDAFPGAVTASVSHWDKINTEIAGAHPTSSNHTITVGTDAEVASNVANLLTSTDVDAIFMQFDDIDHQGHDCCFDPNDTNYRDVIETTDLHVKTVIDALHSRSTFANEDWLILVSSDHGGGGLFADQHGPDTPTDRTMFIIASGPSVVPANMPSGAQRPHITDVAVTALTHLGVRIDPAWGLEGQAIAIPQAQPYVTPAVPMCGAGVGATDPRTFFKGGEKHTHKSTHQH